MTKRRNQVLSVNTDESNSSPIEKDSTKSERIKEELILHSSSSKPHVNLDDDTDNSSSSDASASSSSDDNDDVDTDDDSSTSDTINVSLAEIRHAIALSTEAASKTFGWTQSIEPEEKNELTSVVPGYTAPMSLDSSALDVHKHPSLTKCVSETAPAVSTRWTKSFKHQSQSALRSQKSKTNAGADWFGMEASPDSESLATDIAVIRNRNYLDPKRFYKSSEFKKGKDIGVVQLGTVVEGAMESVFTNRLTKKQRKENVMEEVMGEVFETKHDYVKKAFGRIQRKKTEMSRRGKRPNKKVMKFK